MAKNNTKGSIGGVFEPFKRYVKDQLNARKIILANARLDDETTAVDEYIDFQLNSRYGGSNSESFYAYTTEKQCFIRMMSGVDLKVTKETVKSDLRITPFEESSGILKDPKNLAKQYILEGGTKFYNIKGASGESGGPQGGNREGFTEGGEAEDKKRGFTYGDRNIRSNADEDYGVVPMPGIVDAEIRTKGNNGELREARINFIAFNKRQLDVLETLYMRPGHYVALEWGWDPYIDNDLNRQDNTYSIYRDFFKDNNDINTIDDINFQIKDYKEQSGGNYDGFIGAVKNYTYKVREDGGFDCTTELMAAGELLESLGSTKKTYETDRKLPDSNKFEVEINDSFYYYLNSIKMSLDKDIDELKLRVNETQREHLAEVLEKDVVAILGSTVNQELVNDIVEYYEKELADGNVNVTQEMIDELRNAQYIGNQCPEKGDKDNGPFVMFIEYINPGYFKCAYSNKSGELIPGETVTVVAFDRFGNAVTPMDRNNRKYYGTSENDLSNQQGGVDFFVGADGTQNETEALFNREGEYNILENPYNYNSYNANGNKVYTIEEIQREHNMLKPFDDEISTRHGWTNLWAKKKFTDDSIDNDYMDYFKGCRIVTDDLQSYYRWNTVVGQNTINARFPLAQIKNGQVPEDFYNSQAYTGYGNFSNAPSGPTENWIDPVSPFSGEEYEQVPIEDGPMTLEEYESGLSINYYDNDNHPSTPGHVMHTNINQNGVNNDQRALAHFINKSRYAQVRAVEIKIGEIVAEKHGEAQEQELTQTRHYEQGVKDIISLYKYINKITKQTDAEKTSNQTVTDPDTQEVIRHTPFGFDAQSGEGLEAMLGNTIIKQVSKYKETYYDAEDAGNNQQGSLKDSGYRKNIFVRWDLLCQMLNHLSSYKHDKFDTFQQNLDKNGLKEPLMEFTYLTANQKTWTNRKPSKGKERASYNGEKYYIRYSVPTIQDADPESSIDFWEIPIEDRKSYNPNAENGTLTQYSKTQIGNYHPHLGSSFNSQICLMPHMPIFFNMHINQEVYRDSDFEDSQTGLTNRERDIKEDAIGQNLLSYNLKSNDRKKHQGVRNLVGHVYFNLDYLLGTYEDMRFTRKQGVNYNIITLNRSFNILEYVQALWKGANDASAGQFNFRLITEHERPNKCRVVDMHVSGTPEEAEIFQFEPQGLNAVTRQYFYDSKISSDMASAISIAAQAPRDIDTLEGLSFKAFNKNITSRFKITDDDDDIPGNEARDKLQEDIDSFIQKSNSLNFYLYKLNQGHWVITKGEESLDIPLIGPSSAMSMAEDIRELRASILSRYPLTHSDQTKVGTWREGTTQDVSPIVPLQFNYMMDGMAGHEPLRIFKVAKNRLPIAYNRDDVAFIIKSEQHKITSGQDWTVSVMGQLVLLDVNPNSGEGENPRKGKKVGTDWKTKKLDKPLQPNADIIRNYAALGGGRSSSRVSIKRVESADHIRSWGPTTDELTCNKEGNDIQRETALGFVIMMYLVSGRRSKLQGNNYIDFGTRFEAVSALYHTWTNMHDGSIAKPIFFGGDEKILLKVTSGHDLVHQAWTSTHNSGLGLDFTIYWGKKGRYVWNGQYGPNNTAPNAYKEIDEHILRFIDTLLDYMKEKGIIHKYQNEYTNPSNNSTGPHIHLTFSKNQNLEGILPNSAINV